MTIQRTAASLAAILSLFFAGSALAQVSKDGMGKVLPVELFACSYKEGKGAADLDRAIERWTRWADDRDVDDYAAWTLAPYHYGAEQDFDVVWMGAWSDGNAMGEGLNQYLTSAGDVQAGFDEVVDCGAHILLASAMYKAPAGNVTPSSSIITMMDCELNEGHRYSDIKAAELKWAEYLSDADSPAGYWHWFPTYGGGDQEYDYKVVTAFRDYVELGANFEMFANGGGRERSQEIFGDIDECDDARVYIATSRRAATIR